MTEKAKVVKFPYAGIEIEGLLMPNGEYRIALSQVRRLILAEKNYNLKQLEALSGIKLMAEKVSSDLNPNKVNTIKLSDFSDICFELCLKGDKYPMAKVVAKASIQFTITQAFEVALGIEKTNIEGAKAYEAMVESKKARRSLTDVWQECYKLTGAYPSYGKHTLMLYEKIGLSDRYQEYVEQGFPKNYTFRHDFLTFDERYLITEAETNIKFMINKMGLDVEKAIERL